MIHLAGAPDYGKGKILGKLGQLLISNFYFFFYPDVVHTTNVEGKLYKEIYSNGSRWMSTGWSCLWTTKEDSEKYITAKTFVHTVNTTNNLAERAIKTVTDNS